MEHSLRSPSHSDHSHTPNRPTDSRRVRAARRVPFTRSLHSFVRKQLEQWLPASEISAELVRTADGPWVRCHLEVHGSGVDLAIDELARGPQQALALCARELQLILMARQMAPVPA